MLAHTYTFCGAGYHRSPALLPHPVFFWDGASLSKGTQTLAEMTEFVFITALR